MTKAMSNGVEMIRNIVRANRCGGALGVCSVCSAHPWVLEAALDQANESGSLALIESTSNQVNQFGGYTGKTPADFARETRVLAEKLRFPAERLLLGGDHLGPYPWRKRPAAEAMDNARGMVRDYVLAGYVKIHLDASMPCADDPPGALDSAVAAQRAAELCRAAEDAWAKLPAGSAPPVYVIGTEVPVPGGEQLEAGAPAVTKPEAARQTLEEHRTTFAKLGLEDAFSRVIGLVVQPGVEFGSDNVFGYDRELALHLSAQLPAFPELVYEAHSTDYQSSDALRQMVEDHFAILKVGPWLTFAMREAIFALCSLEEEWLGWRIGVTMSRVRQALEQAMLENGGYWKDYYTGTDGEVRLARAYSFSDRIRYYWPDQKVQSEIETLIRNLTDSPPPLTLLSQFLPAQYEAVRNGTIRSNPVSLIRHRVGQVLEIYLKASGDKQ